VLDKQFSRLENGIKNNKTGEMAVFTKGFRASTLDKKANMKSVSNVDIACIEEGEDIRDEDKFNTFSDSIRKRGSYIIFIMNTPDIYHWIVRRYFNAIPITEEDEPQLTDTERSGYFKLMPKDVHGLVTIQCNYKDNTFLPDKTVRQYEAYGDPDSHLYNLHHYLTSIKGYSTTGLKGQIFKNYDIITPEEFLELDYAECYGQDFGTASPAATVWMKVKGDHVYLKELNYEPLALVELGKKLDEIGMLEDTLIVADCAEPDTIRELRFGISKYLSEEDRERYPNASLGFRNMRPAPNKSIKGGIDKLLSMKIHVTSDSPNLIAEFSQYVWAVDKDGKPSGKPIDAHNHCFVGSTLITTPYGMMPIQSMVQGDLVLTSSGWHQVVHKFDNGRKEVCKYSLIFEDKSKTEIICTYNHKIKTSIGWIEIASLKEGMELYLTKYLMEKHTTCTREKSIFQRVAQDFIPKFGNSLMAKYLKVIIYIILMAISKIIIYPIWNVLKRVSICLNICHQGIKKNLGQEWITPESLQTNGTAQKQDLIFIEKLLKWLGIKQSIKNTTVINAVKNILQEPQESQNTAIKTARLVRLEQGEKYLDNVYDLMIEEEHEYFANGVLVHNCIDCVRYMIQVHGYWF
jgi:PBSX family phage terminase large subunit